MKKLFLLLIFAVLLILTACQYDNTDSFRITTNASYLELGSGNYDVIIDGESYKTSRLDESLPIIGVKSNGFNEVDINYSLVMICSQVKCGSSETSDYYLFSSLDVFLVMIEILRNLNLVIR